MTSLTVIGGSPPTLRNNGGGTLGIEANCCCKKKCKACVDVTVDVANVPYPTQPCPGTLVETCIVTIPNEYSLPVKIRISGVVDDDLMVNGQIIEPGLYPYPKEGNCNGGHYIGGFLGGHYDKIVNSRTVTLKILDNHGAFSGANLTVCVDPLNAQGVCKNPTTNCFNPPPQCTGACSQSGGACAGKQQPCYCCSGYCQTTRCSCCSADLTGRTVTFEGKTFTWGTNNTIIDGNSIWQADFSFSGSGELYKNDFLAEVPGCIPPLTIPTLGIYLTLFCSNQKWVADVYTYCAPRTVSSPCDLQGAAYQARTYLAEISCIDDGPNNRKPYGCLGNIQEYEGSPYNNPELPGQCEAPYADLCIY